MLIMQNVALKVKGMSCGHCVNSVEGALKEIGAMGKVDLTNAEVKVEYDEGKLTLNAIKEAIEEQGYTVV
jgi:copper chaperone